MYSGNIIVTQRSDKILSRSECRDGLDMRFCEWILESGFLPFPIPNSLVEPQDIHNWIDCINPCCIILSGGGDIFHADNRYNLENVLLDHAELQKIAVLGICRGMQVLARRAGVGLKAMQDHVNCLHPLITCDPGELLPVEVNSYHEFCIDAVPPNFHMIAMSDNNCIEGIKHNSLPWEGWMWHPERNISFNKIDAIRLRNLIEGAS